VGNDVPHQVVGDATHPARTDILGPGPLPGLRPRPPAPTRNRFTNTAHLAARAQPRGPAPRVDLRALRSRQRQDQPRESAMTTRPSAVVRATRQQPATLGAGPPQRCSTAASTGGAVVMGLYAAKRGSRAASSPITVAHPTPNAVATWATECPSWPTRRHASTRARSVHALGAGDDARLGSEVVLAGAGHGASRRRRPGWGRVPEPVVLQRSGGCVIGGWVCGTGGVGRLWPVFLRCAGCWG